MPLKWQLFFSLLQRVNILTRMPWRNRHHKPSWDQTRGCCSPLRQAASSLQRRLRVRGQSSDPGWPLASFITSGKQESHLSEALPPQIQTDLTFLDWTHIYKGLALCCMRLNQPLQHWHPALQPQLSPDCSTCGPAAVGTWGANQRMGVCSPSQKDNLGPWKIFNHIKILMLLDYFILLRLKQVGPALWHSELDFHQETMQGG